MSAAGIFVGQLCLAQWALAQESADGGQPGSIRQSNASEVIVVTGSRIRRKDLTTPAPVTIISRELLLASGKSSVGEFLQSLPEQGNATNTSVNNSGTGATRVALRGLGAQRTLVLLNGRRFVPGGNGADSSVDLNSIPAVAIERIEVLKDGASAVYGSDAIAGVVNIITRKSFNGTEAAVYTATSQPHRDGTSYDVGLATGSSGDRGNVAFAAGYFKMNPILAGDRAFSAQPLAYDATGRNGSPTGQPGVYTQGSGTIPAGRIVLKKSERGVVIPTASALYNCLVTNNPTAGSFIEDPAATGPCPGWRVFRGPVLAPAGDGYNFAPQNYLLTPQQRISLYSSGETRLGNFSHGFFEASYVNRQSDQRLAPEPLLTDLEGVTVSAQNAYNPFGRDIAAVRRRLLEFGNRTRQQDLDAFHVAGGVNGTLPDGFGPLRGWFWEIAGNYGRTQGVEIKQGNLRTNKLAQALGPSDPTGKICLDGSGKPIPNCVPLNLFGGAGTIAPDQATNLTFTGTQRGLNQLVTAQVNVGGELFPPFGGRPIGVAAGYEYRNVYGAQIPDPITVAGETTGNKGDITQGRYSSNEAYGELSIPVLAKLPLAEALEATAAARVFRYSNFGSDFTYKLGARWQLIPDLTFRGTYSTAFRAPAISDLFLGQADSFPPVKDPCRGPSGGGPTPPPNCGAQGVADNGDSQSQLRTRVGGNPALQPETARIFTVGAVLAPRPIESFTVAIDYYNIRLFQTISTVGSSTILSTCYPANGAPPAFCDLVKRDPVTGRIVSIADLNANVGQDSTDGIDLAVRYAVPTPAHGRFGFVFDGTWLHKYDRRLADGTLVHGKGNYDLNNQGTGGVYPAFKFNAGVTWGLGGFGAGVSTRFFGSFTECGDSSGDFSGGGLCYKDSTYQRSVGAYNTYDVFLSYDLASSYGKTKVAAGVLNVADKKPQAIYNGFTAASDPTAYDFAGRRPYVRASQSF